MWLSLKNKISAFLVFLYNLIDFHWNKFNFVVLFKSLSPYKWSIYILRVFWKGWFTIYFSSAIWMEREHNCYQATIAKLEQFWSIETHIHFITLIDIDNIEDMLKLAINSLLLPEERTYPWSSVRIYVYTVYIVYRAWNGNANTTYSVIKR